MIDEKTFAALKATKKIFEETKVPADATQILTRFIKWGHLNLTIEDLQKKYNLPKIKICYDGKEMTADELKLHLLLESKKND